MVYPGAVHSRFEHSLGVHFLAGEAIEKIAKYQVRICQLVLTVNIFNIESLMKQLPLSYAISTQGSELGIDRDDIKTVKLAGNQTILSRTKCLARINLQI